MRPNCIFCLISACTDCFESGRCVGNLLTTAVRDSDCDCQSACNDINGCTDFTFDSINGICSLMLSCTSISNCTSCTSGPATCPAGSTTTTTSPSGMIHYGTKANNWLMNKGGIFEAGFGEQIAFSWPSVDRFGKFFGGLMTLGQVKSITNFCWFGQQRAEKRNFWRKKHQTQPHRSHAC